MTLPPASPDPTLPPVQSTGTVTIFTPTGQLAGVLHARTLTAFRTALSSTTLLRRRAVFRTLTVMGSGLQAYWHIRLALMLRGETVRQINIINRRGSTNLQLIMEKFAAIDPAIKQREGWEEARFSSWTPVCQEYNTARKECLRTADVIYCCTPSTEDLFEASEVQGARGCEDRGKLIVAVGSYKPHMRELPRSLLLRAPSHKPLGAVAVDTTAGVIAEAGEVIQAGLEPTQLAE